MTDSIPLLGALFTSMLHVLTGPDHLAAVTPFAIEAKRKAWKVGLLWAIGHLVGMLIIGLLFMALREAIPVDRISQHAEQLVGLVLIIVGIWSIYKIVVKNKKHQHLHLHNGDDPYIHSHSHDHAAMSSHNHSHDRGEIVNQWSSLSIGLIHGVAGIAHALLFLPVLGFGSNLEGFQYIIGFGLGIILSMVVYAILIGKVSSLAKNGHNDMFFNGIRLGAGLFAIIIGCYWFMTS